MSPKRRVANLLKESIEREERLIPIYSDYCAPFSDCLDFNPEMRRRLTETFLQLRDESREHKCGLESVVKELEALS